VAVIDISSRLDVNAASADGLASLFSSYVAAGDARVMAERIVAHVRGDGERPDSMSRASAAQDSLVRALLGRARGPARLRHPVESLEELVTIAGIDPAVLARLTPLLTVDGDATVNRRSAPPSVLQAATGSVTEAPTRLLVVARGWQLGHPLTHEVQAVYDVGNQTVRLIRWRERTL
jgi:type II secretory pathway component PulK